MNSNRLFTCIILVFLMFQTFAQAQIESTNRRVALNTTTTQSALSNQNAYFLNTKDLPTTSNALFLNSWYLSTDLIEQSTTARLIIGANGFAIPMSNYPSLTAGLFDLDEDVPATIL